MDTENLSTQFLADRKAREVFSRIDYFLRSGGHIQRDWPKPEESFRFLERNYESLQSYYWTFFQITLTRDGDDLSSRYYYLDHREGSRTNIPGDSRYKRYMETSHIIIGLLFLKMYKLDLNIELDSTSDFVQLLLTEYEEEKEGLLNFLANNRYEKDTDYSESFIVDETRRAFNEFERLGWISWLDASKGQFTVQPSFERLRKQYADQISRIDELIREAQQ